LSHIKRNGHTSYGEQNYERKNCGRQIVADSQHIGGEKKALVKRLLLERLSLRGICRAEVSLTWLLGFIVCAKGSGRTNIIERFNCTLRQRVSRLARDALSFSKILSNHNVAERSPARPVGACTIVDGWSTAAMNQWAT